MAALELVRAAYSGTVFIGVAVVLLPVPPLVFRAVLVFHGHFSFSTVRHYFASLE